MIRENKFTCPVCKSHANRFYISTKAMMHVPNDEEFNFRLCDHCETVFLANPVSDQDLERYYSEDYLPYRGASAWGKYAFLVEQHQKKLDSSRLKVVKRYLKPNEEALHILDVGCGKPDFLKVVHQKLKLNCTGIDFSDSGWRNGNYADLKLIKTRLEDFQSSDLFDAITLWHYLEHDYEPLKTIQKLHELLKPGGKLIVEVPDYKSITAKFQKSYWQGWHSPRHISLFSKKSFLELFPQDQWKIVKHNRYGTLDAFTLWWLGVMEKKGAFIHVNMEREFWPLVILKILSAPVFLFEKLLPFGVQTLVLEKNKNRPL
jgi:2-polyprenyl-3-methyl-5-hydroxy-6-metoxy-1,4-benzoquinol methylase